VPDPLDDPTAAQRGQGEAREITAEDKTGHRRLEILDCDPLGDQGVKKAVGELDAARRENERPDLRAHCPAWPHLPSLLWRPIEGVTPGEPSQHCRDPAPPVELSDP